MPGLLDSIDPDGLLEYSVVYTADDALHTGRAFAEHGVQIAAGVPLQVGEPDNYKSFRIGLFGVDKLADVDAAVHRLANVLDDVCASAEVFAPSAA